tara:strand:- start:775 stop:1440 length:666 start_codon:yes stop_codon:yes gene_type:complete
MNNKIAIKPQNNYNIWDLVAQGFIDENDVSEKGTILNQEYIDCLATLNLTSISSNTDISNSTPRRNRRQRPPIAPRPRTTNTNTPRVQTTARASARNPRLNSSIASSLISPRYLISPTRPQPIVNVRREERSIFRSVPRVNVSLPVNKDNNEALKEGTSEEKKDEENDKLLCVICLTNQRRYIITPCNHFCLCAKCCNRIKSENKCPICRKMNIKVEKVYL